MKFKVGDEVRIINAGGSYSRFNGLYTKITRLPDNIYDLYLTEIEGRRAFRETEMELTVKSKNETKLKKALGLVE